MKQKTAVQSAFLTRRVLIGLASCILLVPIAFTLHPGGSAFARPKQQQNQPEVPVLAEESAIVPDGTQPEAPTPTLGDYTDTSVNLSGNTTFTPSTAPANTTSLNVSTNTNFKGIFVASPTTGVIRVTDAHPIGNYNVLVTAFGPGGTTTKSFNLTVPSNACGAVSGFDSGASVNPGSDPRSLAIGDFNGDGKQDFAVTNASFGSGTTVSIRLGNGSGGFSNGTNVSVGTLPISVAIGDFNGDGKQDLAVANNSSNTVSIRLGNGSGGFSGSTEVSVGSHPYSVAIGDFNGDGKQDLAVASYNLNTVSVRLGDGTGGFSGSLEVSVGNRPFSVAIGDFNGDGKQDFATANSNSSSASIRLGDGMGGFSGSTEVSVGSSPFSIAIGDFNGDGKQDLAAASDGQDKVSIRLGDGLGGFSGSTEVSVGSGANGIAIGDFNADGNQDIAVATFFSHGVSIRFGDGLGGFGGSMEVSAGGGPQSVAVGDFNGDGRQDLAILDSPVSIRLGVCFVPTPSPTPTPTCTPEPPSAQNFDNVSNLIPIGWYLRNNSQPGPGTTGWFQGNTLIFTAQSGASNSFIAANYNNGTDTSTLSNWLLTPPMTIGPGAGITFWTRTVDVPVYPDRLQVRMSTNGASANVGTTAAAVGDFTTLLLDINPTYSITGYPNGWTQYTVLATGITVPVRGRFAFRYFVENGGPGGANSDFIGIDSIVVNAGSCGGSFATPTPVPSPTPFFCTSIWESFDWPPPPSLPSGWQSSFSSGAANCIPTGTCVGSNWVTTPSNPSAGSLSAFHDAPACVTDSAMTSPTFFIPTGFPIFASFAHSYNLESSRDGGVLEISISGGRFIDIVQAGGSVNYNGTISTQFQSPLAGRSAWTGNSGGYVGASITFPAQAFGRSVALRFRLATDCSGGGSGMGWYIDGLYIWYNCESMTPAPSPTPSASPTPPPVVCSVNEAFNNIATLPSVGWVKRNNSSGFGITDWFQGIPAVFSAQSGGSNAYIAANFNASSGNGTISNWLLLPPITLQDGGVFTFWTRTVSTPSYPDRLQVRMSTNGNSSNVGSGPTATGDFPTLLLDLNPTYTTIGYPTVWTQYTMVLNGVGSPVTGRLAFRYFVENGGSNGLNSDYIGIDSVSYACNAGGVTPTPPPPTPTSTPPQPTATPVPTPSPRPPSPTPPPPTPSPTPTPPPTPSPTSTPCDCTPTPTPISTASPIPGAVKVTAPTFTMGISDGFAVNNQPVTTTFVSPTWNYIGFQADMVYDSAIAAPTPGTAPVAASGLTASGWTVSGNVINTGPGTLRTLRVSAFSNDGVTPLNGAGTLYVIKWKRVSSSVGASNQLIWQPFPNDFEFIDADLNSFSAQQNNGQITITTGGGPTPTPTPVSVSGTVFYCPNPTHVPLPSVTLTLTGSSSGTTLSNGSGGYTFLSLPVGGTYTVTPSKSALVPASNGITTVDVLAVQRHYLGITIIPGGCRLTAADVNGDLAVTTVDVVAIQRFYLGLTTGLANVGKYQFSPANLIYPGLSSNQTNQDYDTLIFGDVAAPFVAP